MKRAINNSEGAKFFDLIGVQVKKIGVKSRNLLLI